jgi:hypothetical protein
MVENAREAMSWRIVNHREAPLGGYDGSVWRFELADEAGRETSVLVKISRSATASSAPSLPEATRLARETAGRSEIGKVLSWFEPPQVIELGTMTERARTEGGSPDQPDESRQVEEIQQWFSDRGIDLWFDQVGTGWFALMIPEGTRVGAADAGHGASRLEAAKDAKARKEAGEAAANPETQSERGSVAETVENVGEAGQVVDEVVRREELEARLADFGWRLAYALEPDGTFRWFVRDDQTGEVLQWGTSQGWDDARLDSIENLYPPSDEGLHG